MVGLPPELQQRCRASLLCCQEFDSDAMVRSVFISPLLWPFRDRLPSAGSKAERVATTLDYLLAQQAGDARPVLPFFLYALRDLYEPGNALRDELEALAGEIETLLATASPQPSLLPLPSAANPFGDVGRITDLARFFDREEVLRRCFEELGKGVNLSLVGESQVGKSSLLTMIGATVPTRLPGMTCAYLSLEWVENEEEFYTALCEGLQVGACRGYKLVRALQGKRIVLCLDEMEKMAWQGFTANLRSQLRGLADGSEAPLKLVIASRSPLARLFPDAPELDSPLAGICHQLDLGPFPPDVARAFLTMRLQATGVTFSDAEITALIHQTGGHPARLQRAAADLFAAKRPS